MPSEDYSKITDWDSKTFQSSNVYSGRYSPSARVMILTFGSKSQREYAYPASPEMWLELKKASSPGSFIRDNLSAFGKELKT